MLHHDGDTTGVADVFFEAILETPPTTASFHNLTLSLTIADTIYISQSSSNKQALVESSKA
jgi:hypothetical protein